jgi:hypothetical protein
MMVMVHLQSMFCDHMGKDVSREDWVAEDSSIDQTDSILSLCCSSVTIETHHTDRYYGSL